MSLRAKKLSTEANQSGAATGVTSQGDKVIRLVGFIAGPALPPWDDLNF
jgi:hypothetical protein